MQALQILLRNRLLRSKANVRPSYGFTASPFAQAFRCVGVLDLAYGQAVVAYHRVIHQAYIGVTGTCALILERISDESRVQVRLTAIEGVKHCSRRSF